jgi:hypothetical protein
MKIYFLIFLIDKINCQVPKTAKNCLNFESKTEIFRCQKKNSKFE